ncbi:NAD(P)H-binding protein [Streptomyces sp. NRRL WC-3742]|uniref:NAD(P)H-binding protein n=1 Tax=Streptomyces sp. NRRL WC-3742 TaxID=1463934 RepID=UPI0004CC2C9F|nr:NAD(P)H-binding protein [Streptomyces sp. NRRL WC-3742]
MTTKRSDDVSTVLVTGASGVVGSQVVAQLAAAGVRVRALTRDGERARRAGFVQGDLRRPETLREAARGADAAFLVWPLPIAGAREAVEALAAEVGRVVFLSSAAVRDVPGAGPQSPGRPDGEVEALLARSGVAHTALRPHGFAANALRWAEEIRSGGVVRGFGGEAALCPVDERDIAAVAVRALTEDGHDGARHYLTGPEAITQAEQVRIIAEATGLPARWEEIPRGAARERMLASGWPAGIVDGALDFLGARIGDPEAVSEAVPAVTGRPARTFRDWARENADRF